MPRFPQLRPLQPGRQRDVGAIGGDRSHEFQVIADTGEDAIVYSPDSDYAANIELAEAGIAPDPRALRELKEAVRRGVDADAIESNDRFQILKTDPEFQKLVQTLKAK